MGRGNVCVQNDFEGLYYIDYDDLSVYNKRYEEDSFVLGRELDYEQLTNGDWLYNEFESNIKWQGDKEYIICRLQERFQSFARCNEWVDRTCHAVLENQLFYIAFEDNEWSIAIELLEKYGPYGDDYAGLKAKHYQTYLDGMKEILFELYEELGTYSGAWTSGTIRREKEVA